MATYAIGDIQGCYKTFLALLEKIRFDRQKDNLWLTGDLINRGPESLAVLRWVYEFERAIVVLGNHDLHLLAVQAGTAPIKPSDTITDILNAPDVDKLCHWLMQKALLHYDEEHNTILSHAGIYPAWDRATAQQCAAEVEQVLKSKHYKDFFANMYGNQPAVWSNHLQGWDRLRFITNVFTRMRLVSPEGELELTKKDATKKVNDYYPWFNLPRKARNTKIIFGHWAALECNTGDEPNVFAIDSGCFWGNSLTALRLDDWQRFQVPNAEDQLKI